MTCAGLTNDDYCAVAGCPVEPSGDHCWCWRALDAAPCCRCGDDPAEEREAEVRRRAQDHAASVRGRA